MLSRRPFKRIGRMPIRRTLVSVQVNYYNGEPEDGVRLCELCNGKMMLSGWPRAGIGEKRPREKSFVLDDATAQMYLYKLDNIKVCPSSNPRRGEDLREAVKIKFGQGDTASSFSWENGAPGKWRDLDVFVQGIVFFFHDMCRSMP